MLTIAAGIDVGQKYLDVGLAPLGQTFRVRNGQEGIETVLTRLRQAGIVRVLLEAIGPYAHGVAYALAQAGFEVGIVNPQRIKSFRAAEGSRAKTDRLDAGLIARFALVMREAIRPLPTLDQLALKALSLRRRQLAEMIAMEKTRLKLALEPLLIASHRSAIAALSAECKTIEAELDRRLAADAALRRKREILVSVPGIGPRIASVLLTDLPELGSTDRKAIASLAGLAPHVSQSGNMPARAAIAGGRPCVRTALYLAALVASRHNRVLKAEYQAMRMSGKAAKVALIAIARKIVVMLNALVKSDTLYEATRLQNAPPA